MKYNKVIYILLFGALTLTGCSDFLEPDSEYKRTPEQVFNSVEETELKLNGTYGLLTGNIYSTYLTTIFCNNSDVELVDEGKDTKIDVDNFRGYMNYVNMSGAKSYSAITTLWNNAYAIIEDCNEIIDGINKSSIKDDAKMKQFLGEALTIRALMYMEVTRLWGDVPLMMEPAKADLSNVYTGKVDRDYILDKMLESLEEAQGYLEGTTNNSRHVTKYFVEALYGQIALQRCGYAIREPQRNQPYAEVGYEGYVNASTDADVRKTLSDENYPTLRCSDDVRNELYAKAIVKLNDVIQNGGYQLVSSFDQYWTDVNLRKDDISENIFEIPMGFNVSSELGSTVGVKLNWSSSEVHNSYGVGNSAYPKLALPLYDSYEKDDEGNCIDARRDVTCSLITVENLAAGDANPADGVVDDKNERVYEKPIGDHPFNIYPSKWDARKLYEQSNGWAQQNSSVSAKWNYGIRAVRMRLPQVLLYYAEMYNELANNGGTLPDGLSMTAIEAINMVHQRATGKTVDVSDDYNDIFNAIVDENKWEFAGEGFRKFDLIRWNLLAYKILEMKETYAKSFKADTYSKKISYDYGYYWMYGQNENEASSCLKITKVYIYNSDNIDDAMVQDATDGFGAKMDNYNKGKTVDNLDKHLPMISMGLVGKEITTKGFPDIVKPTEGGVKNRYLLPLTNDIVNNSNHILNNSYNF